MKNNFVLLADHLAGVLRNLPIIFIITFVILIAPSAPAQNVELVGRLGQSLIASDIFIRGDTAVTVGWSHGLSVVDITNPSEPQLLPGCALPWYSERVFVSGNYAYIANIGACFLIVDLRAYPAPQLIGSFYYSNWCFNVDVQDSIAALAFGGTDPPESLPSGAGIINISDPAEPSMIAFYETETFVRAVDIRGDYLYVGFDRSSSPARCFDVLDISNPANPVLVGSADIPHGVHEFCMEENYAYLIRYGSTFHVADISDPTNPFVVGQYDTEAQISDAAVAQEYLYTITTRYGGGVDAIQIFDLTSKTNPLLGGYYEIEAYSVATDGEYIYTADGLNGLSVFSFEPAFGSISGTVVSLQSGEPVEGAVVEASPSAFVDTTSTDGRFLFENLPNFTYDLNITHIDYFDSSIQDILVIANDTVETLMTLNHRPYLDVGVTSILSPYDQVMDGGHYPLKVKIINTGVTPVTFNMAFEIWLSDFSRSVLVDTLTVFDMPEISVDTVTFAESLLAVLGESYYFKSYSMLSGDENAANDTSVAQSNSILPMYLIFGNRDGSLMFGQPGQVIDMNIWGATPGNNFPDSIIFMHIPLASNDSIVAERLGGYFPDTLVGNWDDVSFLTPDFNSPQPGWTNQSLLGFADVIDPREEENFFWTDGDTILIATFQMHLSDDLELLGNTYCPFQEGANPSNGNLLWGNSMGTDQYIPITTYPCLYFPPPCEYLLGDVNSDGIANGVDVIFSVNYFKYGGGPPLDSCNCSPIAFPFFAAGDVNGSCSFNGVDILYMVNYYKGIVPPFDACDYCPPGSYDSMRSRPSLNPEYHAPALKPGLKKKQELE